MMELKLTESELTKYFKEALFPANSINESLTSTDKKDIQTTVRKEIKDFLDVTKSSDLEKKVKSIVKDMLRSDKDLEKYVVTITRNILVQLYKNLWMRRAFWSNDLKNSTT